MRSYLRLFLKLFIAETIALGLLVSILAVIQDTPVSAALTNGLLVGAILGFILSLVASLLHLRSVKAILLEGYEEALGVHHKRSVDLQLSRDEAFDLCLDLLESINGYQVQMERAEGKVVARVAAIGKRDVITLSLDKSTGGKARLIISSRPALRTTMIDFGRNLKNVEKLVAYIEKAESRG
jgi:hypothetical protein